MAISDYLLRRLSLRNTILQQQAAERQQQLALEQAKAQREAQLGANNVNSIAALGTAGIKGLLGIGDLAQKAYDQDQADQNALIEAQSIIFGGERANPTVQGDPLAKTAAKPTFDAATAGPPADKKAVDSILMPPVEIYKKEQGNPNMSDAEAFVRHGAAQIPITVGSVDDQMGGTETMPSWQTRAESKIPAFSNTPKAEIPMPTVGAGEPILPPSATAGTLAEPGVIDDTMEAADMPAGDADMETIEVKSFKLSDKGGAPIKSTGEIVPEPKAKPDVDWEAPEVKEAMKDAEKVTGYKPIEYRLSDSEAADKVVAEVERLRPQNNPLSALFSRGRSVEEARAIAKARAMMSIRELRQKEAQAHADNYIKMQQIPMNDARVDYIRAQAEAKAAAASGEDKKKPLSEPQRKVLENYQTARQGYNNLASATKRVIEKGQGLPIGPLRQALSGDIYAQGADVSAPGMAGSGKGAGGGVTLPGAGIQGTTSEQSASSGGGKFVDPEKLQKAWDAYDKTSMTPEQKEFANAFVMFIQSEGRKREGGRMTDSDFRLYAENLLAQDPKTFARQFNTYALNSAELYSQAYNSMSNSVSSGLDSYPRVLDIMLFSDEDIDKMREDYERAGFEKPDETKPPKPARERFQENRPKPTARPTVNGGGGGAKKTVNASELEE